MRKKFWIKMAGKLSVQQKMIAALMCCIIVPIILLGIISTMWVVRLSEKNQYEMQINQLLKYGQEIENNYEALIREAAVLSSDTSIMAVLKQEASVIDYRQASGKLLESAGKITSCSAITISRNAEILFQRGELYLGEYEDEGYINKLEHEKKPYIWADVHPIVFEKGIYKTEIEHISYYRTIMKTVTLETEGVLGIHINAGAFIQEVIPQNNNGELDNIFIINNEGELFGELTENESLRTESLKQYALEDAENEYGYFSLRHEENNYIVLYTKCGGSGWTLFQAEEQMPLYNIQILLVSSVIILCIGFGIAYGIIQNFTIIKPLQHLSHRIDSIKAGVIEKKEYEVVYDEIGRVEKAFEEMVDYINHLIKQVYIQEIKTKDAEREMLLSKMNPHFLYNSLDAIHWLAIRNKDYEVSELLEALADVYRHILSFGFEMVTVKEEMEFMHSYLLLMEYQLGDRISFCEDIPEYLNSYRIPKLMLQPLVENAIQHGLKDIQENGKIKVRMRKSGTKLKVSVLDNGVGCDAESLKKMLKDESARKAFALRNIHERLSLRYGEDNGIKIFSRSNRCTIVSFVVELEGE